MTREISFIPKNVPKYKARVLGKESKELYKESFAKTAEKFGKDSLAYKNITNEIDPENITGSQFLFNTELGLYLPKSSEILNLQYMDDILAQDKDFFDGFYTDTNQLVLRTNKASYHKNQNIINHLEKQLKNSGYEFFKENPLVITNPELILDKKNLEQGYGLLVKIGENTKLENDKRFASGNKKINLGNLEKTLWTKENGLSGVCLGWNRGLDSSVGNLPDSDGGGRVVVVSDGGIAPKILDEYKSNLEKERQKQIDIINNRYGKAMDILKG